jgi:hypothetical protein
MEPGLDPLPKRIAHIRKVALVGDGTGAGEQDVVAVGGAERRDGIIDRRAPASQVSAQAGLEGAGHHLGERRVGHELVR